MAPTNEPEVSLYFHNPCKFFCAWLNVAQLSGFMSLGPEDLAKIALNVCTFQTHVRNNEAFYALTQIDKDRFFIVDLEILVGDQLFLDKWPQFEEDLSTSTEFTLKCFSLALHQCLSVLDTPHKQTSKIRARISNHKPLLGLRDINVGCLGECFKYFERWVLMMKPYR